MNNLKPYAVDGSGNTVIWSNGGGGLFTNINGNMVPCDENASPIQQIQQQPNNGGLQPVAWDNFNNPTVFKDPNGNIYDNTPNGLVQRQIANNQIANGYQQQPAMPQVQSYNQQQQAQQPNISYQQPTISTVGTAGNVSSDRYKHLEKEFTKSEPLVTMEATPVVKEVTVVELFKYRNTDNNNLVPFCDEEVNSVEVFTNDSDKSFSYKIVEKV